MTTLAQIPSRIWFFYNTLSQIPHYQQALYQALLLTSFCATFCATFCTIFLTLLLWVKGPRNSWLLLVTSPLTADHKRILTTVVKNRCWYYSDFLLIVSPYSYRSRFFIPVSLAVRWLACFKGNSSSSVLNILIASVVIVLSGFFSLP